MASTQQLDFQQAMRDFKTMFPGMDDAVIEVCNSLQVYMVNGQHHKYI